MPRSTRLDSRYCSMGSGKGASGTAVITSGIGQGPGESCVIWFLSPHHLATRGVPAGVFGSARPDPV